MGTDEAALVRGEKSGSLSDDRRSSHGPKAAVAPVCCYKR
jgi:hypothetical protein